MSNDELASFTNALTKSYIDLANQKCFRIKLSKIHSLGSAIKELSPAIKAIKDNLLDKDGGLYELANLVSNNKWENVTKKIKTLENAKEQISNSSINVDNLPQIPPEILLVCGLLVSIEESLLLLNENQNKIYSFLKKDKESEIEGDLNILNNFLNEYKFNYDDNEYCKTHLNMVLEIKRSSMQKMVFYQKEVNSILEEKHKIIFSNNIKSVFENLNNNLSYYRMSLYLFAYSSFLEVLLNKNFEMDYLNEVDSTIKTQINFYNDSINKSKEYASSIGSSSIEKKVGNTFKSVTNKIGGLFSKKDDNKEKEPEINKVLNEEIEKLESLSNDGCDSFIDNIANLHFIYSESSKILINQDEIILL